MTATKTDTDPKLDVEEPDDIELIEAALDALAGSSPLTLLSRPQAAAAAGRIGRRALTRSPKVVARAVRLSGEQAKIGLGLSAIKPEADKRFNDEAFQHNPLYRRLAQNYLAWNEAVHEVIDELGLDEKSNLRGHFVASLVTEAVAPTNTLVGNPAALREAVKSRGASLRRGMRHWLHDVRGNGGMPSMVDTRPFKVGENIAATPGVVVARSEVFELIRYEPATEEVYSRPLLIVPPEINKYYVLDLAPGRSMVEAAVAAGHQVFMMSWRNPGPDQRVWDLDTYCGAVLDAIDATLALTAQEDLNLMGVCAGGMTTAATLGQMAAVGDRRVNSVTLPVTVLDWGVPSVVGTFTSGPSVAAAIRRSQAKGVLAGSDLSKLFAWLRPNDLVWNYVVNNYLMGRNPPAFDILAWNADTTNLPAGLHADFLDIASTNALAEPGGVQVMGEKVDLSSVTCDAYVVGGLTDHITPWQGCYRTVDLLGGRAEFVLAGSGHIQTLVCPLDSPKARYFTNPGHAHDAQAWRDAATEHQGSWWAHWLGWLAPRAGERQPSPLRLDSSSYPVLEAAPGRYVRE